MITNETTPKSLVISGVRLLLALDVLRYFWSSTTFGDSHHQRVEFFHPYYVDLAVCGVMKVSTPEKKLVVKKAYEKYLQPLHRRLNDEHNSTDRRVSHSVEIVFHEAFRDEVGHPFNDDVIEFVERVARGDYDDSHSFTMSDEEE